ncbi:TetR/AcrR family transcriptional regulator [Pseudonocardia endophytica]|uniref:TetR family transcriptional regulator n=1 Tax=Pseudonocardia endophytica TaxID=401976 RepID=A0A4R1HRA7_PSEEN|nr:TetR/AcrR family transcriptional regulator [Pseudonocardia endophytica]TCK25117.1 TetR family transcriptional regulator [Pseudonocardia endophytica]
MSTTDPAHLRDAGRTRQALLDAAGELFTSEGYDRTTVRAIAERAGVNQALLFRYFGNKEALFARVLAAQAMDVLHGGPPEELLERTLRSILVPADADAAARSGLFDSALRSAGNSEVVDALRDELGTAYTTEFAAIAGGTGSDDPDARLRAELLLGWLLGVNFLRNVLHSETIRDADPDVVVGHVVRAAATMLHGVRPTGADPAVDS